MGLNIQPPRDKVINVKTKRGNMKVTLRWNANFQPKWQGQFNRAQTVLDSEILRGCNARYVPKDTGMLIKRGILGTKPGSGLVQWLGPYVRFQYYLVNRKTSRNVNPQGGPYWFQRFWSVQGRALMNRVKKIAGGTGS